MRALPEKVKGEIQLQFLGKINLKTGSSDLFYTTLWIQKNDVSDIVAEQAVIEIKHLVHSRLCSLYEML